MVASVSTLPSTNWADVVVKFYNEGYSDVEVCKELKVTLKQFKKLYAENDKFAEIIDFGRTLAHAWWMSKARGNLNSRDFNTSLFVMVMKNQYSWADKVETTTASDDGATSADMRDKLLLELPGLLKRLRPDLSESKLLEVLNGSEQLQSPAG